MARCDVARTFVLRDAIIIVQTIQNLNRELLIKLDMLQLSWFHLLGCYYCPRC